ncbi:MAG TPA: TetR/AcrR family transcriptional regulator [Candidatus Binatia bacterium]|nr:TetR/AcrR family transcriptional regulator [Candidatus Binatia bacterium]
MRLAPGARRDELLRAAARLLTDRGVDAVQFAEVANAAGVTRQLVYKFFPNRQTLLMAVLEDFAGELTRRFGESALQSLPDNMGDATRIFVEAVCDTIDAKGAGPWHLLDAKGSDAEVAKLGRAIADRLLAPWLGRIKHATGATPREVTALARMIVAAGRAVLDLWYDGTLTRDEAVRDASRGVSAMLGAFTVTASGPRRR